MFEPDEQGKVKINNKNCWMTLSNAAPIPSNVLRYMEYIRPHVHYIYITGYFN